MSDSPKDPMAHAATRLEAAVERLARALAGHPVPGAVGGAVAGGVLREQLGALAQRLDETVARLRDVLGEELEEAEPDEPGAEPGAGRVADIQER